MKLRTQLALSFLLLAVLIAAGEAWRGGESQGDDMTFVVLKVDS